MTDHIPGQREFTRAKGWHLRDYLGPVEIWENANHEFEIDFYIISPKILSKWKKPVLLKSENLTQDCAWEAFIKAEEAIGKLVNNDPMKTFFIPYSTIEKTPGEGKVDYVPLPPKKI